MRAETINRNVPGLVVLRTYQSRWLAKDVVAGLVLSALLVPQGMAYAQLAGLPAVTGLYTSILCLVGYAIFGPSKILVLGPDSSLGPMIAATILPLMGAGGDPARAVALASMLALFTGTAMVLAGVGRLGFIADLLSMPTMLGYMNGLALTILVGQLPKLFGFSVDADNFIRELTGFVSGVAAGEIVSAAAAVGIGALLLILLLQRYLPKLPSVLIAVVAAIIAATAFSLEAKGVVLVGVLPQGLPSFTIPQVGWSDLLPLIGGALGIALVALADTISVASAFAERQGDELDGNREMVGLGVANLAAGLFQGFPVSTSGSRTAVAEQSGSKTQVTGLVGAGVITLMLLLFPGLLQNLPQPTLAAVVIAASLSLADLPATRRLWSQSRSEFILSLTAFVGVVLLGVLLGIVVAITLSVANVFRRTWWPYQAILGRRPGVAGYHDITRHPEAELLTGCTIFRFDAPLIFANAHTFRDQIRALAKSSPRHGWIIVAAEPLTDVDTTACDMLEDLVTELDRQGVTLVFAEMKGPVKEKTRQFGLGATIPDDRFFPTLGTAVKAWRVAGTRAGGVGHDQDG
ncbi:MAG: sulfate permease [Actinomycetota bacterium]